MNWNSIKIFLEISSSGDLQIAARTLGLSHSTVFRQIKKLEEDIGTPLFERLSGRYELTEVGEALVVQAQSISARFDEIARSVSSHNHRLSGVVRVAAPSSLSHSFLPQYFYTFQEKHPDIHVELLVSNDEENPSSRQADVAVRVAAAPPAHLVGRRVRSSGGRVLH